MIRRKKLKAPSEILKLYGARLSEGLEQKLSPSVFELSFNYQSHKVASISGFIVFRNGWLLEFDEIVKQVGNKIERLKYRYHIMDRDKNLVLRYDNVAHHPKIETHPHHKHLPHKVIESGAPNLLEVIKEIELMLIKQT